MAKKWSGNETRGRVVLSWKSAILPFTAVFSLSTGTNDTILNTVHTRPALCNNFYGMWNCVVNRTYLAPLGPLNEARV